MRPFSCVVSNVPPNTSAAYVGVERGGLRMSVKRLLLACVLSLLPGAVFAQSGISGLVTDTSGAVLPGVTVEASSPALIERTRAVTTDGQGRFSIVDLRPGEYRLTF